LRRPDLRLFHGGTAPENLTGKIRRFNPTHLIVIDAAELGKRPGTIALLKPEETTAPLLTHRLPIKLLLDYLAKEISFKPLVFGIQPRSLEYGWPVSKEIGHAAKDLAGLLFIALQKTSIKK
jgi:hydrogenase 3 maturation protease